VDGVAVPDAGSPDQDQHALAARLPAAFWLGGGCGSGKTTLARWAALRLDLRFYPLDGHNYVHARRAAAGGYPLTDAASRQSAGEMWLREAADLAASFAAVSAERLQMALDDLCALGDGPTVIVEGPQLFPDLVAPFLRSPRHGLWLLPTTDFGYRGVIERGGARPEATGQRRRERDALLTQMHREQAARLGLPVFEVDGSMSLAQTADLVADRVANLPGGITSAGDGPERQRIRQAENAIHVRQLLGWWADMGLVRMPEPPVFSFSCECELPGCTQLVRMPVTEYQRQAASGPVTTGSGTGERAD
jgi:hypothetical protein